MFGGDFIISIIIVGDLEDASIGNFFFENLSKQFSVSYFSNGRFLESGIGQEIMLYETDKIAQCNFKNCVMIIKKQCSINICNEFESNTVAIVSSEQQNHLKLLSKLNLRTITCGSSSKDTVTFSSKNDDEIVISLQRAISTINGEIIEPFEMPMKKSIEDDDFTLLAYVSLLIETGIIDKNWH